MREGIRTRLIRVGFRDSTLATQNLERLGDAGLLDPLKIVSNLESFDPDPDGALIGLVRVLERQPDLAEDLRGDEAFLRSVLTLFAGSTASGDFFSRHPEALREVHEDSDTLAAPETLTRRIRECVNVTVEDASGQRVAAITGEEGAAKLRTRYRIELAKIALYDARLDDPAVSLHRVAAALADLAGAAIDAAVAIARAEISAPPAGFGRFPAEQVADVRLAVIGMGKCGARELNYISDVDVMFVAEPREGSDLSTARTIDIASRLASTAMHVIMDYGVEPGLWEVDANLRPEGKDGALVRTIDSYLTYYRRWAHNWEFMALLKARCIAGDQELGDALVAELTPMVWGAAGRDNFVVQVQAMRARVISHIPEDEVTREIKLGPGGLRDVEFTVQLLQLVHGQVDEDLRVQSTLDALSALAAGGHIGRDDGEQFDSDYRFLRLIEHRAQLRHMQRTHLFPEDAAELRVLSRAVRLGRPGILEEEYKRVRRRVRGIHEKVFYRPLLTAAATLPTESYQLTDDQATARLRATGYRDPRGALAHIRALVGGVSRRSTMMRNLLPVLLEWFSQGPNPDQGLLAFRKLSEQLGDESWYLRLLRDSNVAARRLCSVLSSSEFCAAFLELFPEAVIWLDGDDQLAPRTDEALEHELVGALTRYSDEASLSRFIRGVRRREVLRLAIGFVLGVNGMAETSRGLTNVAVASIRAAERAVRIVDNVDYPPFAVIGMGRFGGAELGFGSDLDVLYVYDPVDRVSEDASRAARTLVTRIGTILEDIRLPIDLDAGLRPEGKSGPLARSLAAYEAYYSKWSLGWEAQALLRAQPVAGDPQLRERFMAIADRTRYRDRPLERQELTEIRRIKARIESERLPHGADPRRHLKLGRGSLSDVEWLVQSIQLDHAHEVPELRTTSTLEALEVAREHDFVSTDDAETLTDAWVLASRIRSAVYLYSNAQTDVLPGNSEELDGIGRLLGYEPGSGVELENDYLTATRRARTVFETLFYGD